MLVSCIDKKLKEEHCAVYYNDKVVRDGNKPSPTHPEECEIFLGEYKFYIFWPSSKKNSPKW